MWIFERKSRRSLEERYQREKFSNLRIDPIITKTKVYPWCSSLGSFGLNICSRFIWILHTWKSSKWWDRICISVGLYHSSSRFSTRTWKTRKFIRNGNRAGDRHYTFWCNLLKLSEVRIKESVNKNKWDWIFIITIKPYTWKVTTS